MPKNSDLHDEVVKILFELCKEAKTEAGKPIYSSIYADHIGEKYKPIIFTSYIGKKKKPLAKKYNPDVWAQVKRKREFDICEVWHSETETEAVEDILFSSLVGGIRFLHIVCTGENLTKEETRELVDLILHRIHDEEGVSLLDSTNVYISDLPEKLWGDGVKVKRYLKRELSF